MRPTFPQYGISIAKVAATRSEDKNTKAGCAAFDKNWHTIGTFYNGFLPKQKVPNDIWEDRERKNLFVIHAENWMVSKTMNGEVAKVCLNISPCHKCAVLLAVHGVKEVYFEEEYHREQQFKDIFKFYKIKWKIIRPYECHL